MSDTNRSFLEANTLYWDQLYAKGRNGFKYQIKTIDHMNQRYNTVGDYYYGGDGTLVLLISRMDDWKMEYLVAYHELSEIPLCWAAGVTIKQIDDFDLWFDSQRTSGDSSEPGDDPRAPYHKQHLFATQQEKAMAKMLGVDWDEYEAKIVELMEARVLASIDE